MNGVKVTKTVVRAIHVGQNPRYVCLTAGCVWQHVSVQAQQCSSSAADKGWRFVPDAILPGHRRAPQWVPTRTPTAHCGLNSRKAVGGPFGCKHWAVRLLSCTYEPLTQGNGVNPNHNGSITERDVPKQSSHVREKCALNVACCESNFYQWSVCCPHTSCPSIPAKHGRRRSERARCSQRERYVQGWFLLVTMHFALLVTTVVCARLVFAGDDALGAVVPSRSRCG